MARLGWNPGAGMVYLRGILPAPLNRFRTFTPTTFQVGPRVTSLGTGLTSTWLYRSEYRVTLELPFISAKVYDGERGTIRAGQLIARLQLGGTVDVDVADDAGVGVITAWLTEGTEPSLTLENPQDMLYTLSVSLTNTTTNFAAVYGGLNP